MIRAKRTATGKRRFPAKIVAAIDDAHYLWIRAGTDHRFIGIWAVVANGRVFVRSWYMKPAGWFEALRESPLGAITIGERVIPIRAVRVRSAPLLAAVDKAYAAKYTTPASIKYVRGFARGKRRETTTELTPR